MSEYDIIIFYIKGMLVDIPDFNKATETNVAHNKVPSNNDTNLEQIIHPVVENNAGEDIENSKNLLKSKLSVQEGTKNIKETVPENKDTGPNLMDKDVHKHSVNNANGNMSDNKSKDQETDKGRNDNAVHVDPNQHLE